MTEAEALTMSAETFQSRVNEKGLLLLVSGRTDAVLDRCQLLTLTGNSKWVECFSK